MKIPIKDRSNYLKGLLIIARKDNQLAESEKIIIRGVAEKLGFATDFYEETLQSLLTNKYILDDPLQFSDIKIAKSFVNDGLRLAYSDNKISDVELGWLKETALFNNLDEEWFNTKVELIKNSAPTIMTSDFSLLSII